MEGLDSEKRLGPCAITPLLAVPALKLLLYSRRHDLLAALRVEEAVQQVLLNCKPDAGICPQGQGLTID